MTREDAEDYIKTWCPYSQVNAIIAALSYTWIPIKTRPLTDKEKEEYADLGYADKQGGDGMTREEYGTDGNVYQMSISNGKEFSTCGDTVSREAITEHLKSIAETIDVKEIGGDYNTGFYDGLEFAIDFVITLPGVQPCGDAVSREAVLDYIRDNYRRWFINDDAFMQCVNGIKDMNDERR